MHLYFRNVNDAFTTLVRSIDAKLNPKTAVPQQLTGTTDIEIRRQDSRNGPVYRFMGGPVTITYTNPLERVLFNRARDANPFFHLYEALWMLAGRNDVAPLRYYVSTIDQFSDDGKTFNGAYGYRWRHADKYCLIERYFPCRVDQLKVIIDHLRNNPTSRRPVLHMSNVQDDLLKMDTTKDQCCNLLAMFDIREEASDLAYGPNHPDVESGKAEAGKPLYETHRYLDMTVINRSNDMIWGMLGANVVHFSFLQEYMATCIGVEVGHYHQVTNNLHVYEWNWKPEEWLNDRTPDFYSMGFPLHWEDEAYNPGLPYRWFSPSRFVGTPLLADQGVFDSEVQFFVELHRQDSLARPFENRFLRTVAQPACIAWHYHKRHKYGDSLYAASHIHDLDWRMACVNWLTKRRDDYEKRLVADAGHRIT